VLAVSTDISVSLGAISVGTVSPARAGVTSATETEAVCEVCRKQMIDAGNGLLWTGKRGRSERRVTCSLLSHAGMDVRTLTRRAAGEYPEQGVIDGRPVVALGWGFEATLKTLGCGEL
jgi:hypothetical protein